MRQCVRCGYGLVGDQTLCSECGQSNDPSAVRAVARVRAWDRAWYSVAAFVVGVFSSCLLWMMLDFAGNSNQRVVFPFCVANLAGLFVATFCALRPCRSALTRVLLVSALAVSAVTLVLVLALVGWSLCR